MTVHVLDNSGNPPGETATLASIFEFALAFTLSTTQYLRELRWYRAASGGARRPVTLDLWDATTQAIVYQVTAVPDSGSAGWQTATIGELVPLSAGREYRVAGGWQVGTTVATYSSALTAPPSPISLPTNYRWFHQNSLSFPDTGPYAATGVGVDVGVDVNPPTGATPGPGLADVQNALADWLSTTDGTKTDSAPLQDHTSINTIHSVVGDTAGQLDATKAVSDTIHDLLTSANHNLGTLWDLAGHLATLEITAWQHFFGTGESRLTGPNSGGGSAFYTADGQLVSQLIAEIWQRTLALRNTSAFGLSPWTLSAETDFTDAIAFAQPADAYVLTITSYQPTQPATEGPAGLWLPRLGWWCVLTGSLAASRAFVEFQEQLLTNGGERMAGCAIQLKPGTMAHVQAWLLA